MVNRGPSRLVLHPERCTQCRDCVDACDENAVKVTSTHLYVDWRKCAGCLQCVSACETRAIEAVPALAIAGGASGAPKLVVGSRAEAKTLRRRAEEEARRTEKNARRTQKADARAERTAEHEHAVDADGTASWTLADAGIVAAVLLGLLFLKDYVLGTRLVHLLPIAAGVGARVGVLAVFYGIQLLVLAALAKRKGLTFVKAFGLGRLARGWRHRAVSAGLVLVLLVVTRAVTTLYGATAQGLGWRPPERLAGDFTDLFGAGLAGFLLSALLVALVAPVVEELVFRGVVQGGLAAWGEWVAIVGSAALFAGYHLTAWWFVPTFLLGIALGWLAWSRRGIWPPIALHAAYNAVAVLAAYYVASGR